MGKTSGGRLAPWPFMPPAPSIPPVPTLVTLWHLSVPLGFVCPECQPPPCLTIAALPGSNVSTDTQPWPTCPLQGYLQFPQHQPVHLLGCQVGQHFSKAYLLGTEQGMVGTARGQSR